MHQLTDLRLASKEAQEFRRYRSQKTKWARGMRPLGGCSELRADGRGRPAPPRKTHESRYAGPEKLPRSVRSNIRHHDTQEAIDARHEDDSRLTISADDPNTPDNHPDVFYSYDARRSPNLGEHTLSVALARALDRFDVKETEKLVREYEFVSESDGSDDGERTADEDDYEIVDFVTL